MSEFSQQTCTEGDSRQQSTPGGCIPLCSGPQQQPAGGWLRDGCRPIEPGRLEGSFRLGGSRQLRFLSIQNNQDLLLQGNRRPGVLPISLRTTDQQPVVREKDTQPGSRHGFNTGLSDSFVQLPAGADIRVALVSQTRFEQLATATGNHQTLDVIYRSNSANLHPQRFEEISALIEAQLMGGGQDDLVEVAALEALSPHQLRGKASGDLGVRAGLMKDLIDWGSRTPAKQSPWMTCARPSKPHAPQSFTTAVRPSALAP